MSGAGEATRVLLLSGLQVHPPLSGGNLRTVGLATALRRQGLEVLVYSMVGRKADYLARRPSSIETWPDGIREYVDRGPLGFVAQFGSYRLGLPPLWLTACLRAAARWPGESLLPPLLREKLQWCDAVIADFPFVHPVFEVPSARGRLRVLSTHNLEHRLYASAVLRRIVRAVEVHAAREADVVVGCCAGDREFFEGAGARATVLVPNGIDLARFRGLRGQRRATRRALGIPDDARVFLFTASKYGPNRESFAYLSAFARAHAWTLADRKVRILVVGSVTPAPVRIGPLTATGRVDRVEPYFAAADAALNPIWSGAGTNVKMGEFIAARLPIVTSSFGARGYAVENGRTGFLFEKDGLLPVLATVRRLFDQDPDRLRLMADEAYERNRDVIDMDVCVRWLVEAMESARHPRLDAPAPAVAAWPPAASV